MQKYEGKITVYACTYRYSKAMLFSDIGWRHTVPLQFCNIENKFCHHGTFAQSPGFLDRICFRSHEWYTLNVRTSLHFESCGCETTVVRVLGCWDIVAAV
jgi:hypothetical protein